MHVDAVINSSKYQPTFVNGFPSTSIILSIKNVSIACKWPDAKACKDPGH